MRALWLLTCMDTHTQQSRIRHRTASLTRDIATFIDLRRAEHTTPLQMADTRCWMSETAALTHNDTRCCTDARHTLVTALIAESDGLH